MTAPACPPSRSRSLLGEVLTPLAPSPSGEGRRKGEAPPDNLTVA